MEVHHHPEVEKKGFKEYILEGLMIFLAVFMGFIAENIRENITNREHAEQLCTQLVSDLKADTLRLDHLALRAGNLAKENDSLYHLLQQPVAKIDMKRLQQLVSGAYHVPIFYPSAGAITSIKNELHLKEFANSKVSVYITKYESSVVILKEVEKIQMSYMGNIEAFFEDHYMPENMYSIFHDKGVVNGNVRNLTQNDLTRLSIRLVLIQSYNSAMIELDKQLSKDAVTLMQYVTTQYHLKDK